MEMKLQPNYKHWKDKLMKSIEDIDNYIYRFKFTSLIDKMLDKYPCCFKPNIKFSLIYATKLAISLTCKSCKQGIYQIIDKRDILYNGIPTIENNEDIQTLKINFPKKQLSVIEQMNADITELLSDINRRKKNKEE